MDTSPKRTALAWTTAALLTLVGGALFVVDVLTPTSFGWFAYTPLSNADVFPTNDLVVFTRSGAIGGVLLTVGLVILAFLIGAWSGSRRDRSPRA